MKLFSFLLLGMFLSSGAQHQLNCSGSTFAEGLVSQVSDSEPTILYLEWFGNNLVVIGESFSEGATVLINGQPLTTRNDKVSPTVVLVAKKARKKIPRAQEITVQVENSNGNRSQGVAFYSGITITAGDQGPEPIHLRVGDIFLLYLTVGDPAAVKWSVKILGPDPGIVTRLSEPPPIPKSQGFFRVNAAGRFDIQAVGSPQCPPLPPERCSIAGSSGPSFQATIIVE